MGKSNTSLEQIFESLGNKNHYKYLVKTRIVKITLGSSIIRAFTAGTKPDLQNGLIKIKIDDILKLKSQKAYDNWHIKQIKKVNFLLARIDKNIITPLFGASISFNCRRVGASPTVGASISSITVELAHCWREHILQLP